MGGGRQVQTDQELAVKQFLRAYLDKEKDE